jgi:hypothetical protein
MPINYNEFNNYPHLELNPHLGELKDIIHTAPRTIGSTAHLGSCAIDKWHSAKTEIELYDWIAGMMKDYVGFILFVRVLPEQALSSSWYVRLQFIKPEDMKTL